MQAFAREDFHGGKWAYGEHFYAGHKKTRFEDLATLAKQYPGRILGVVTIVGHSQMTSRSVVERCTNWMRKNGPNAM